MPLSVAVIIPTYNRATLVCEAIDSVLAQTRPPNEIIVVDDGSTDNTKEALHQYGSSIHIISQANRGRSAARNVGLESSSSDLAAFLDSDDKLMPQSIQQRAELLETKPDIDVVYSDAKLIDNTGCDLIQFSEAATAPKVSGDIFYELALYNIIFLGTVMLRRNCAKGVGLFDENLHLAEDYDFFLRLAAQYRIQYLDQTTAYYRIHNGMTTRNEENALRNKELEVHRRIFDMLAFRKLSRAQQAHIYRSHGSRYMNLNNSPMARRWYKEAISCLPSSPHAYLLIALSIFGPRIFNQLLKIRQPMAEYRKGFQI